MSIFMALHVSGAPNYVQARCASNIPDEPDSAQCGCALDEL
jgi:hypothetical protein